MAEYAVARLEDIAEISDGREPWRPVRQHFGITSFGINSWTAHEAGDRIMRTAFASEPQTTILAREVVEAHPEYPALLYNLACAESLAGRKADAIEHLRMAVEDSDSVRAYLEKDSDLDPLRDEPEFQALLAG
jgi:hypothetical protein